MSDELVASQYLARILGDLNVTGLKPIDPKTNQAAAQRASEAAMRQMLAADLLDFYLLGDDGGSINAVRYYDVPLRTRGVVLTGQPGTIQRSSVPIWIEDDRALVRVLTERDDAGVIPLSSVIAALAFRKLFGLGKRRVDLGPEFGSFEFTPTHIEIGWRPAQPSGAGHPWYRFAYNDPGISNYVALTDYHDATSGTWLWFTDPRTGRPSDQWWKVSHLVRMVSDEPSERVDDPLRPPPRLPNYLRRPEDPAAAS